MTPKRLQKKKGSIFPSKIIPRSNGNGPQKPGCAHARHFGNSTCTKVYLDREQWISKQNKTFCSFEKKNPIFCLRRKDNRLLWYFFSLIIFFSEIWSKNYSFCTHVCLPLCIMHDMFMWLLDYKWGFWSSSLWSAFHHHHLFKLSKS